ncbi:histidine kinase dimerization/phospho-acceptor domain-containing protein [Bacteroides sp.]
MKDKIRIYLIWMIILISPQQLLSTTSDEKLLKDSIFQAAYNIPNDSLRSLYLRNMFQRHIGKEWAVEFLDSAQAIASRGHVNTEEIAACFDHFRHHQYSSDIPNMEHWLNILKECSYRSKYFDYYFSAWNIFLQSKSAQGDTEYVIMETKRMKEEAIRLKNESGIYLSQITLAQAFYFSGKSEEAITAYKQALKYPGLKTKDKILIHGQLAIINQWLENYKESISELEQQRFEIEQAIRQNPENRYMYKNQLLDNELSFCKIYLDMELEKELKHHLECAKKLYSDDCFLSYYIAYHSYWGGYYYLKQEWEKCFKEFDMALSRFKGKQPFYEDGIRRMKAYAVMASGRFKEAAEIYKYAALMGDSLNREILKRHEEVHRANYKIQKALLDKEETIRQYRLIAIAASGLLLIILIFAIIRTLRIQSEMKRSQQQTLKALDTVTAANKLKEVFLKNITYEIRIPLNAVVGLSELLSIEKDLSEEEIQEYSTIIKNNSEKLLHLINNVLDLSRLEAKMMRFNVQMYDAVQLCKEAKMMVEMQENNPVHPVFHTELESLTFRADSSWFLKLLTSVLSAPKEYKEVETVEYTLIKNNRNLQITIEGSPLCKWTEDEQGRRIQHDINRLYLETFQGSYRLLTEEGKKTIVITYPL